MRLPLQSKSKAQRRQLLRQLIWSLCLVAPGSLSFADDNAEKKNEPKAAPALSLPTFPTSLPSPPTVASPTNTPSSTPKAQSKEGSAPPAMLPPLPPSVTAPPVANNTAPTVVAPNVTRKDAVIISMPNTTPAAAPPSVAAKQLPAAPSTSSGAAGLSPSTVAPVAKATEQVSIKFGEVPEANKDRNNPVSGQRPNTANAPVVDEPATFRLSDKASTTNPTPAPLNSTSPQNARPTLQAPTPAAPTLVMPEPPKPLKAEAVKATTVKNNPVPSATKPVESKPTETKPVESKAVDTKSAEAKPQLGTTAAQPQPQPLGSLTISKQGIAPSVPEKSEGRREAVLIRPKAIVLGQEPASIAAKAAQEKATSTPLPISTPAPTAKPSTMPQMLANNAGTANPAPMKKADSKVSPLPPSQLPAAEKIAIQAVVPPVLALDTKPQVNATVEVAKPKTDIAALPSLTAAPPSVIVAKPAPSLTLNQDTEPPVVSDAEIAVEATLVSAKKYSKPADRTIQVGTVALTTMRVGEKDVVKCEVDDTSVCRAIVTADGEVALLPGKVGVTRATLWVKEPNGQSKVETADIQVGEVLPIANADAVEIGKLNDSLQRLYPNTNLRVVASDRCLEICGEADNEQQAREVLQLVRKLCLVPVKDKVTVR